MANKGRKWSIFSSNDIIGVWDRLQVKKRFFLAEYNYSSLIYIYFIIHGNVLINSEFLSSIYVYGKIMSFWNCFEDVGNQKSAKVRTTKFGWFWCKINFIKYPFPNGTPSQKRFLSLARVFEFHWYCLSNCLSNCLSD